jgi:hypothetical protein
LTLKLLTAQPEGGDAEELLRLDSNKRAEQIYALNLKKTFSSQGVLLKKAYKTSSSSPEARSRKGESSTLLQE